MRHRTMLCAACSAVLFWLASITFAVVFVATGWADGPTYRAPRMAAQPVADAPAPFNWTGLYVGGGLGVGLAGREGSNEVSEYPYQIIDPAFFDQNLAGDLRVGYDWQLTNTPLVLGALAGYEFDFGGDVLDGTWYLGGRLGLAFATRTLPYVGVAWQPEFDDKIRYMVGIEQAVLPAASLGLEYGYTDLGGGFDTHDFKIRINFRPAGLFLP